MSTLEDKLGPEKSSEPDKDVKVDSMETGINEDTTHVTNTVGLFVHYNMADPLLYTSWIAYRQPVGKTHLGLRDVRVFPIAKRFDDCCLYNVRHSWTLYLAG